MRSVHFIEARKKGKRTIGALLIGLVLFFVFVFQASAQEVELEIGGGPDSDLQIEGGSGEEGVPTEASVEITVTEAKSDSIHKKTPVTTRVIRRERIEKRGSRNLFDTLRGNAGVLGENNCNNCNFTGVRLNGLEDKYNQILLNGVPIIGSLASVYILEQLPQGMIDRVEVVRGGESALYGPGAVGGVINLIMRKPTTDFMETDIRQSWMDGIYPMTDVSFGVSRVSESEKYGAMAYGTVVRENAYFRNEDSFSERGSVEAANVGLNGFITPFDGGQLQYSLMYNQEDRKGGEAFDDMPVQLEYEDYRNIASARRTGFTYDQLEEANLSDAEKLQLIEDGGAGKVDGEFVREPYLYGIAEWVSSKQYGGILKWEHSVTSKVSYELYGAASESFRNTYYGANPLYYNYGSTRPDPNIDTDGDGVDDAWDVNDDGEAEEDTGLAGYGKTRSPLGVMGSTLKFSTENHILIAGLQYSYEEMIDVRSSKSSPVDRGISGSSRDTNRDLGGILQYEGKFDWMDIIVGGRLDDHSKIDENMFSPRAAAVFHMLDDKIHFRLSASSGFQAPKTFVEDFHLAVIGGEATTIENDRDLKPERSQSYSSHMDYEATLLGAKINVSLGGFRTRLEDAFVLESETSPQEELAADLTARSVGNLPVGVGGAYLKEEADNFKEDLTEEIDSRTPESKKLYPDSTWIRKNSSGAHVEGGDLEVRISYKNFDIGGSVTVQTSRYEDVSGDFYRRDFMKVPGVYANADASYSYENFTWTVDVIYTGNMLMPHYAGYIPMDVLERTPTFREYGARMAWKFVRDRDAYWEAYLGVRNIDNEYQQDLDRGVFRDAGYVYGPTRPLTYYVGMKGRF